MKKLIIVCTIMVMALVMAMPCFASGVPDTFIWQETFQGTYLAEGNYHMPFVSNGEEYAYVQAHHYSDDHYTMLYCYSNGVAAFVYDSKEGGWLDESFRTIKILEPEKLTEQMKTFIGQFGTFVQPPISSGDILGVYDKLKEQITVKTVVQVLVVLATAVVGIVFMWWGVRKLSRAVFSAFRKGKISL